MPPDLPNQQEITLKKRARRRLVGAVALVLLMVIVLPTILQDRATLAPPQAIKITMTTPPAASELTLPNEKVVDIKDALVDAPAVVSAPVITPEPAAVAAQPKPAEPQEKSPLDQKVEQLVASDNAAETVKKSEPKPEVAKKAETHTPAKPKAAEAKVTETKANERKPLEIKPNPPQSNESKPSTAVKAAEAKATPKTAGSFSVQVGVFSDADNVKHLQGKLKEIGYNTHTEKLATPKGEKIRLRAGSFTTRQDAVAAQAKIQKIGLASMVVSND